MVSILNTQNRVKSADYMILEFLLASGWSFTLKIPSESTAYDLNLSVVCLHLEGKLLPCTLSKTPGLATLHQLGICIYAYNSLLSSYHNPRITASLIMFTDTVFGLQLGKAMAMTRAMKSNAKIFLFIDSNKSQNICHQAIKLLPLHLHSPHKALPSLQVPVNHLQLASWGYPY